jgi:hypothetical protein
LLYYYLYILCLHLHKLLEGCLTIRGS